MKEEPTPVSQIQHATPPALDYVIKLCLAKDPELRWNSAGDLKHQLKWIAEGSAPPGIAAPRTTLYSGRERWAWGVAALALLLAAGAIARGSRSLPAQAGPQRFSILLPEKSALRSAVISPDG